MGPVKLHLSSLNRAEKGPIRTLWLFGRWEGFCSFWITDTWLLNCDVFLTECLNLVSLILSNYVILFLIRPVEVRCTFALSCVVKYNFMKTMIVKDVLSFLSFTRFSILSLMIEWLVVSLLSYSHICIHFVVQSRDISN